MDSGKHGNAVFPLVLQSACLNKTGYDDSSYSVVSDKKLLTNFSEKELVTCMLPNGEKVVSQGTEQYLLKVVRDLLLNIHKVFTLLICMLTYFPVWILLLSL